MHTLKIKNFDIEKIANSGQCFRMNKIENNTFELVAYNRHLIIKNKHDNEFQFYCNENDFNNIWFNYFDLGTDYDTIISTIPKSDIFLQKAASVGYGIRILRQDPWEMLISFIISQRKNIPSIKKSVESLCCNFGTEISASKFSFPTPAVLAVQHEESLKTCSLGYRTNYIINTSRMVNNNSINLGDILVLDDNTLMETLLKFPGVGPKVASCIMLFGYYRVAAFPIDVWINRILEKEYNGNFDLSPFKEHAGIIQQYMFYYAQNSIEYKIKK